MKIIVAFLFFMVLLPSLSAAEQDTIYLLPVPYDTGTTVMEALQARASATGFDTTRFTARELSGLLWAANGINRPASGKRTAASAVNAQDIDIFVCMEEGVWLYDPKQHRLVPVTPVDHRPSIASRQEWTLNAPVFLLLVSDISRFSHGNDSTKLIRAAMDAGIVAQNISLYCAAVGLETRIRAVMDIPVIHRELGLKPTQFPMLNTPVGYPEKSRNDKP